MRKMKIYASLFRNPRITSMCCKCCSEDLPDDEATVKVDDNGVENVNFSESEKAEHKDLEKMVSDL